MSFEQNVIFEHYKTRRQNTSRGWREDPSVWPLSGLSLADRIQPGERVLDVGCANNVFKQLLPNVVGIDPAFAAADHQSRIEDYAPEDLFDVAFCLSVFNWGTHNDIQRQIAATVRCLKPRSRIYLRLAQNAQGAGSRQGLVTLKQRQQSGLFMDPDQCVPYCWTEHRVRWWADHFAFRVTELCWDYHRRADRYRLFSVWERG
jgi:hypothetical protein